MSHRKIWRVVSGAWFWTRVVVTLVAWTACAAIVGLVAALSIPGLLIIGVAIPIWCYWQEWRRA